MVDHLLTLLSNPSSCVLLSAPTAWGKTSLILELWHTSNRPILFLAPLRAIALEFYERAKKENAHHLYWGRSKLPPGSLTIATAEMWSELCLPPDSIVVLDELHLYLMWGHEFRPRLMDIIEELGSKEIATLALTATMGDSLVDQWKSMATLNWNSCWYLYLGFGPKHQPAKILTLPTFFRPLILWILPLFLLKGRGIIFCRYRREVLWLNQYFTKRGIETISCVGGESEEFSNRLKRSHSFQIIVSTKVLSHGVNLPSIRWIIILYREPETELYWQMIGRGGRNGEKFYVLKMY